MMFFNAPPVYKLPPAILDEIEDQIQTYSDGWDGQVAQLSQPLQNNLLIMKPHCVNNLRSNLEHKEVQQIEDNIETYYAYRRR